MSYRWGFSASIASVVQATQPCSVTMSEDDMVFRVAVSVWESEQSCSSMGISLTPTEKRVRKRFGSFTRRSETLCGRVASTLVL